jgi:hypothetical protein
MDKFEFRVEVRGPRPPFAELAEHLWGAAVDFDSDGNSASAEDTNWTQLTISKRPECEERVDVDPVSEAPLVLKIVSTSRDLALRTARFLAATSNGRIAASTQGQMHMSEVAERLWRAAERWPSPNPQELEHLELLLSRLPSDQCFAVLAEPFAKDAPQRVAGDAQEYAGRLLLRLKPAPPHDATTTIRLLLSNWDVSVEQVPWYLEATIGRDALLERLSEMQRRSELTEDRSETVRFWLRVPVEERQ